jgi:hypothetical protein
VARIVLISPYLKGGQNAAKLAQRTRYVATRPGVKLLADERSTLPATKKAARCGCTCEPVWKCIFCAAIVKETFAKVVALCAGLWYVLWLPKGLRDGIDAESRRKLLRLLDAQNALLVEAKLMSFMAGFKLAAGIAGELGAPYSFDTDEEQKAKEMITNG